MSKLLYNILNLPPIWIYLVVAVLVFAEDAVFIGFLLPGETAALLAGVSATVGSTHWPVVTAVVVAAAILGDTVGYEVGKHFFGPKMLNSHYFSRHHAKLAKANDFFLRRGGVAVLLGRFTAFFRAMMPALAGASGMPYRTFLFWNALGGIVWGSLVVGLGYLAGQSYQTVEHLLGRETAVVALLAIGGAVIVWKIRRKRQDSAAERNYSAQPG